MLIIISECLCPDDIPDCVLQQENAVTGEVTSLSISILGNVDRVPSLSSFIFHESCWRFCIFFSVNRVVGYDFLFQQNYCFFKGHKNPDDQKMAAQCSVSLCCHLVVVWKLHKHFFKVQLASGFGSCVCHLVPSFRQQNVFNVNLKKDSSSQTRQH